MAMNFLVCSLLFLLPFSESVEFKFDRFNATNMLYSGDAVPVPSAGTIEFNKVNYLTRVGQAKYYDTVQIWDCKSGKLADFSTQFTFIIDTLGQSVYGHGLTFFLAPESFQIPANSGSGFLGLFNRTTYNDSTLNQLIFIEFDSFVNNEWDPPYEHVGINNNSIASATQAAWNASLHSGETTGVWVTYNATTQYLDVLWTYGGNPITGLSYKVDLRDVLPERVMVGFSAATGVNVERHILQFWEFSSSLNIVENEGNLCKWKLAAGIGVPLGVVVLVTMIACDVFRRKQRKAAEKPMQNVSLTSTNDDLERGAGPKRFSYSDLVSATNNFSNDRKLGQGGFGCVYKGYLTRENMVVAVKKISQGSKQGKKEYITEVKVISSLRHRNLVRLIGWCHDQAKFLLVYEFMPNGSLDSHLFGQKTPLEWAVRYKIAMGLASALLYLHEDWEKCVVHRDIKTSNIMLDSGFNVKLADFGLARIMDHELGPQTTRLAGTLGYLAPEYVMTGKASKESDVYSFGVVALEIASGRKTTDGVDSDSDLGLVQWVWGFLGKGELLSGVDPRLKEFDLKQVECLMMVGLWCAHPDRNLRPSIRQAIQVLKFEGVVPKLPTKMPIPMYYIEPDAPSFGATSITYTSIDRAQ
ncbi:hypothetical protein M8C21_003784 [Ambrosia artemisiifolia]|uniref:Protein kinase domain-containing protein n=1 Tax=Ambrosia artemisiifolia TaxID=4212 RepID=A0AAD5CZP9_AMBAR|nr:hypothetical protein M8C21_003784 [Ambrosia artemisiifolia]